MEKDDEKVKIVSGLSGTIGFLALVVVLTNWLYPSISIPLWIVAISTVIIILTILAWVIVVIIIIVIVVLFRK